MSAEEANANAAATETNASPKPAVELAPQQKANPKYYYWHGHEKERAAVGDVAPKASPQLLKSEALPASGSPQLRTAAISKFSWCNNEKNVSVYVDFDGVEELSKKEGAVGVEFSKRHLNVQIIAESGVYHRLHLRLAKEVDCAACSSRFKPNQIVIKLVKPEGNTETWFDLEAPKASGGSDSD